MDEHTRKTEIDILRSLDGELNDDEQLALNRELIRNPQAQQLYDSYRRLDAMTGAVLEDLIPDRVTPFDPATLPSRVAVVAKRSSRRGWWLIPGAIAAALLAVVVNRVNLPEASTQPAGSARTAGSARPVGEVMPSQPFAGPTWPGPAARPESLMRNVSMTPQRRTRRDIDRDILGIMGDDGRIYLIEVKRTRTLKRPKRMTGAQLVSHAM